MRTQPSFCSGSWWMAWYTAISKGLPPYLPNQLEAWNSVAAACLTCRGLGCRFLPVQECAMKDTRRIEINTDSPLSKMWQIERLSWGFPGITGLEPFHIGAHVSIDSRSRQDSCQARVLCRQGVVHRNLTLANLLLDGHAGKPTVKISGFAYSKAPDLDSGAECHFCALLFPFCCSFPIVWPACAMQPIKMCTMSMQDKGM